MRLSDIGNIRCKASTDITYPLPSRPTTIKLLYFPHFGIFFLFKKENACKRKANCAHKKASKHRLKVSLFAPCCEKTLEMRTHSCAPFLACHQKSNTFKCKQFCCAKPMCAYLSVGYAPRPRQRHAAVHSARLSISCSAHSRANAPELERMRARASCFASRSLACLNWISNTAARLWKT